jgi:hypothetical protein
VDRSTEIGGFRKRIASSCNSRPAPGPTRPGSQTATRIHAPRNRETWDERDVRHHKAEAGRAGGWSRKADRDAALQSTTRSPHGTSVQLASVASRAPTSILRPLSTNSAHRTSGFQTLAVKANRCRRPFATTGAYILVRKTLAWPEESPSFAF